jgi:hypothetical protein
LVPINMFSNDHWCCHSWLHHTSVPINISISHLKLMNILSNDNHFGSWRIIM